MDQPISPHIVQSRQRRVKVLVVGVFGLILFGSWGANQALRPSISKGSIVVSEVRSGSVANTINATGLIIPMREEQVTSGTPTRVIKVHAKAGQQVAAGELLISLDDHSTQLAADSLKEQIAQQDIKIASLELDMAQKTKQIASAIELLALDLRTAQVKWDRYRAFAESGVIAKNDVLTAELNVQRFEIQLRQQKEQIEDTRRTTQSNIAAARLQVDILNKQLEQQLSQLKKAQVRAPFAGMLTWLLADEGANVSVGQMVAKVSELANFGVEASVSDFHARALAAGQKVTVEQGGQTLQGRVHTVLPEIQNGSVKLLITLDQPNHPLLRHKLRVEVNIVTGEANDTLVVDSGPAFNGRGQQDAFIVRDDMAHKTVLNLGVSDGKLIEVLGGAKPGDRVITSDLKQLKSRDSFRITQ